jgi:EpsI family protein
MNLYVVQKGIEKLLVLYWYQSHGRIIASEYWGKYYLVRDAIRLHRTDAALVRITTDFSPNDDGAARARAEEFARLLVRQLKGVIPE